MQHQPVLITPPVKHREGSLGASKMRQLLQSTWTVCSSLYFLKGAHTYWRVICFNPSRSPRENFLFSRCTNESKLSQILTKATNIIQQKSFSATSDHYSCKAKMKGLLWCRNLQFKKLFVSLNCTELILATPLSCYQQPAQTNYKATALH